LPFAIHWIIEALMSTPEFYCRLKELGSLVGNTPLLAIHFTYKGVPRRLFAKAENLNMTGSIKDRMALHILRKGYERGVLVPGAPIAEATSGNTGISFAAIGRALGHPVTIFMPNWMSQERKDLIRSLGGQIRLVSPEEGGFLGSIALSEAFAAETPDCFLPRQFANVDNAGAHRASTGPEIWWQLQGQGLAPDAFVAGVGTGGTVIFSDDNKKYLSTDLMRQEPVKAGFLTTDIRLTAFRAAKRVCRTCCDEASCQYLDGTGTGAARPCKD